MSPSQVLDILDEGNGTEGALKAPETTQDGVSFRCLNNCEDNTFDMEALLDQQRGAADEVKDEEVDIIECSSARGIGLGEGDDTDAAEYSSSFGGTESEHDDELRLSDAEVNSLSDCDNGLNHYDRLFPRKKKLTAHWRKYIRPLMWRCRWVELRVKEFQSQALKYDRELAAYDQRKLFELGQYAPESCVRSLPFSRESYRTEAMKRRKRKRIEDTADIASYMSGHNLFSYYENKKSDADGASADDDCGNQVTGADVNSNDEFDVNHEWPSFEFKDDDTSLEQILWKIEIVQAKVQKLNSQIEEVIATNAEKFSSVENLSQLVPNDLPNSSTRSPTSSPGNVDIMQNGAFYSPTRHIQDYLGDLVMPISAVSSYGEATPLPDIIESTMLLPADEDKPQVGYSCEEMMGNGLIHNQAGGKVLPKLETVGSLHIEIPQEPINEEQEKATTGNATTSAPAPAPLLAPKPEPQETNVAQDQSALKQCLTSEVHVPKNKRKRGERKAGLGAWNSETMSNQRTQGDSDKHRS